jgi:hypothetical protein
MRRYLPISVRHFDAALPAGGQANRQVGIDHAASLGGFWAAKQRACLTALQEPCLWTGTITKGTSGPSGINDVGTAQDVARGLGLAADAACGLSRERPAADFTAGYPQDPKPKLAELALRGHSGSDGERIAKQNRGPDPDGRIREPLRAGVCARVMGFTRSRQRCRAWSAGSAPPRSHRHCSNVSAKITKPAVALVDRALGVVWNDAGPKGGQIAGFETSTRGRARARVMGSY